MDEFLGLSLKRLNRSSYILSIFASVFLFIIIALILDSIIYSISGFTLSEEDSVGIFMILATVSWWTFAIYCGIRRFHDFGMSGWWMVACFVPLLNIILGFKLAFLRGDLEKNKYGEPIDGTFILGLGYRRSHDQSAK